MRINTEQERKDTTSQTTYKGMFERLPYALKSHVESARSSNQSGQLGWVRVFIFIAIIATNVRSSQTGDGPVRLKALRLCMDQASGATSGRKRDIFKRYNVSASCNLIERSSFMTSRLASYTSCMNKQAQKEGNKKY